MAPNAEEESGGASKVVAQVHEQLMKRFQPAAKGIAEAGANLSRSFQNLHKCCDAYIKALQTVADSGSTALGDAKQTAADIEKLAITMRDINDMNNAQIGKFAQLVAKMASYSQKDKDILKQFYHDYEAREKEIKKEVHKGKKEHGELQQFYEKHKRLALNYQLVRYKFLNDQHREWLRGYTALFQSANDVLGDEGKEETKEEKDVDLSEEKDDEQGKKEQVGENPKPSEDDARSLEVAANGDDNSLHNPNVILLKPGAVIDAVDLKQFDESTQINGTKDTGVQASAVDEFVAMRRSAGYKLFPDADYPVDSDPQWSTPAAKRLSTNERYNQQDDDEQYINSFSRRQQYLQLDAEREDDSPPRPTHGNAHREPVPSPPNRRKTEQLTPPVPGRRQPQSSSFEVEPFTYEPPKPPARSFASGRPLSEISGNAPQPRSEGVIFRPGNINAVPTAFVATFGPRDYGKMLVCVHNFHAQSPTQLSLTAGERMVLIKSGSKGWIFAKHVDTERTGWFPSRFAELLSGDSATDTSL